MRFTASRGGADENKQYWYRVPGGLAEGPNTIVRFDTARSGYMRGYEPWEVVEERLDNGGV